MKHYLFYAFLAVMPMTSISSAQQPLDAASVTQIVTQGNKPVIDEIKNQTKALKDSIIPAIAKAQPSVTKPSKTVQDILTFLPVGFFLFILIAVFFKLRKDKVKLSDILIDKETVLERKKVEASIAESHAKVATAAAAAVAANPNAPVAPESFSPADSGAPVQSETTINPEQSTSRLIVFICGITSIALACCITSYYFYKSFTGDGKVDLGNLTNVLYGLGLGVLPYGFNKIAAALK